MTQTATLSYADREVRPRGSPRLALGLGISGCIVGFLATVIPLWPLAQFYRVPPGTFMRPMALTALLVLFAAAGLFVSFPLSLACLVFGWRTRSARWLTLLGIVFSGSATVLGFLLFNWIVAARGFVLEP